MTQATRLSALRYRAFISYSHQDKAWADWLHKALENYAVPSQLIGQCTAAGIIPKRLIPIFRDRDELASAHDLGRKVNEALAQSANLIVICSPRAAGSHWVNEEVLSFKRLGRDERIFCLIVEGEPNASDLPGREPDECFAPALRFQLDDHGQLGTQRAEPIAADTRRGKDGKTNAKLKLIAGMLDVGFDALKQRELHRRARRMTALAALAIVIMAITTTLAISALISRHAANVARADAERRQGQAEKLVGFMLGDLNDKLRDVNRLDILQTVDDKAMAYFNSLPSKDVNDVALAMRVSALQKIGSVRQDQGQIPAALESYSEASTLAAELLRRSPSDVQRKADYANSLTWIGYAHWYQGDLVHAYQNFRSASDALEEDHAARPANTTLAFQLSSALTNTGRVLEAQGDFAAAKTKYQAVQQIFENLVVREPHNAKWQSGLGNAHDSLGKLALERGQLTQAIRDYRINQRIQQKLTSANPSDHGLQYELLISDAILGRTLSLCGDLDDASSYLANALMLARTLIRFGPTDTNLQFLLARYSEQLGGVLRQQKKFTRAAAVDSQSLETLERLTEKDLTNTEWRQELARSRIERARLHMDEHENEAAETLISSALGSLALLRSNSADDRNLVLLSAQAAIISGQLAAQRQEMQNARASWTNALKLVTPAVRSGNDPNFLATQASALLLLDKAYAAGPALTMLAEMGYQTPDFAQLAASKHVAFDQAVGSPWRARDASMSE